MRPGSEQVVALRGVVAVCALALTVLTATAQPAGQAGQAADVQAVIARQASLVTTFDVNGLTVLVKRREGSRTVAAGLFVRGGSRNITAANAGIETLMLNVATEASVGFPRERLRSELARTGAVIGSGSNQDYSVVSLASTRASFDRMWNVFVDVVLHPAFTKEDFDLVKNRTLTSLADDADNPDSYLQQLLERAAYANHPYLNDPRGTTESVSRLTLDDVRRYHQQIMETSRLLLVVVGDLDPAQLRQQVTASFGKLPRGTYRDQAVPPLSFSATTVDVVQRALPTNYIEGVFSAPSLTSPDFYPLQVATAVLRDRIFIEVREKRSLSYTPNAFMNGYAANIGGLYVTAVDANQTVRLMLDEIRRLQTEPVPETDITAVGFAYLTSYYMGQETNAAQAASLAEQELRGNGWRNAFDAIARLRAVTPADVQRVSQKYMRNIRFVVLGNSAQIDKSVFTGGGK